MKRIISIFIILSLLSACSKRIEYVSDQFRAGIRNYDIGDLLDEYTKENPKNKSKLGDRSWDPSFIFINYIADAQNHDEKIIIVSDSVLISDENNTFPAIILIGNNKVIDAYHEYSSGMFRSAYYDNERDSLILMLDTRYIEKRILEIKIKNKSLSINDLGSFRFDRYQP